MGVGLAEERKPWGSLPGEVHEALVTGYEQTGVSPPVNVLAEMVGSDSTSVGRALKSLIHQGLIAQPHGPRSGYIPLYRPDGTRVKPKLVVVGGESEEESSKPEDVDLEQVSTEKLLIEVLRRTQKDESK